jgi:uncharacterized membrane protein HdeD (DUF308 family)
MNQLDRNVRPSDSRSSAVLESALRHKSSWCANVGIALIIFGVLAISVIPFPDINSVILIGWLMVVSGLVEAVHAFYLRKSDAFLFHLVPAIAGLPIGVLIVTHPSAGAVAWMLVFASSFTVIGLFRTISAVHLRFHAWQWAALDGVITLLLAAIFWTASVMFVPWFFCLAVGVSLIFRGLSSIMFGMGWSSSSHGVHSERLHNYQREEAYITQFLQSRSK